MQTRAWGRGGRVVRAAIIAGALGLALPPTSLAQGGSPGARGDIFDRLNSSSMRPLPSLPPAPAPRQDAIWVPDRYLSLPGIPGPVHVPGHWEHRVAPYEVFTPPLVGRAPDGRQVLFPAGVRPTVDQRQAP